jgi:hypothetical protein
MMQQVLFVLIFPALPALAGSAMANSVSASDGASASCATASDCNLNGDCIGGACVCDKGWRGSPTCGVLTLGAVDKV